MNGLEPVIQRFDPGSLGRMAVCLWVAAHLLGALLNCFLGYFICRIQLVVLLAILGGVGAAALAAAAATQLPVAVMVLMTLAAAALLGYAA